MIDGNVFFEENGLFVSKTATIRPIAAIRLPAIMKISAIRNRKLKFLRIGYVELFFRDRDGVFEFFVDRNRKVVRIVDVDEDDIQIAVIFFDQFATEFQSVLQWEIDERGGKRIQFRIG